MTLEKGWLDKQFSKVAAEIKEWPEWMRRQSGFKSEQAKPGVSETEVSQSCSAPGPASSEEPSK